MITLLVDKTSRRVHFWLPASEYAAHYGLIQTVWQMRQTNLEEAFVAPSFLPKDWRENWCTYTYDRSFKTAPITPAQERSITAGYDEVILRITAYRSQMQQLAAMGLPTTEIGVQKMRLVAQLAQKFLSRDGTPAERAHWSKIVDTLWPKLDYVRAAQEAVMRDKAYDDMVLTFVGRGSLL